MLLAIPVVLPCPASVLTTCDSNHGLNFANNTDTLFNTCAQLRVQPHRERFNDASTQGYVQKCSNYLVVAVNAAYAMIVLISDIDLMSHTDNTSRPLECGLFTFSIKESFGATCLC